MTTTGTPKTSRPSTPRSNASTSKKPANAAPARPTPKDAASASSNSRQPRTAQVRYQSDASTATRVLPDLSDFASKEQAGQVLRPARNAFHQAASDKSYVESLPPLEKIQFEKTYNKIRGLVEKYQEDIGIEFRDLAEVHSEMIRFFDLVLAVQDETLRAMLAFTQQKFDEATAYSAALHEKSLAHTEAEVAKTKKYVDEQIFVHTGAKSSLYFTAYLVGSVVAFVTFLVQFFWIGFFKSPVREVCFLVAIAAGIAIVIVAIGLSVHKRSSSHNEQYDGTEALVEQDY